MAGYHYHKHFVSDLQSGTSRWTFQPTDAERTTTIKIRGPEATELEKSKENSLLAR